MVAVAIAVDAIIDVAILFKDKNVCNKGPRKIFQRRNRIFFPDVKLVKRKINLSTLEEKLFCSHL